VGGKQRWAAASCPLRGFYWWGKETAPFIRLNLSVWTNFAVTYFH